jgi:hypothetical protein
MADEPTDDERPVFRQEALDAILQKRLAEDRAKLAVKRRPRCHKSEDTDAEG